MDKFKGHGKTEFSIVYKFGHYSCMSMLHHCPYFRKYAGLLVGTVVSLGFFYKYMYLDSPFGSIREFLSLGHLKLEFFFGVFWSQCPKSTVRAQEGMLTREHNFFVSSAKTSLSCESQTSLCQCFVLECCMKPFNPLGCSSPKEFILCGVVSQFPWHFQNWLVIRD